MDTTITNILFNSIIIRFAVFAFASVACLLAFFIFWYPSFGSTTTTTFSYIPQNDDALYHQRNQTSISDADDNHNNKEDNGAKCEKSMPLVYVYTLPEKYNLGLVSQCHNLNINRDMCPHVANSGLGQTLSDINMGSYTAAASWFATNQFTAEMILHARLLNHPCRTWDPARATLFYVPYYGGLHSSSKVREQNLTARDELDVGLAAFIQSQPWWRKNNGKDHCMTLGRTAWDFMRALKQADFNGASSLLNLPAPKNMSVLIIERHPWLGKNQHGIPYPSYFHPSTWREMVTWQNKIRRTERPHLFSFIGAPRKNVPMRDGMIRQCGESARCELVACGVNETESKCHHPSEVLRVMTQTRFCLQAPGDSLTRRSTFDSMLSGCMPVFFSRGTAYTQYPWFLPSDASAYSVYIDANGNASKRIEEELLKIPSERVAAMRERIVDLIPRLTYANPNATNLGFADVVDVALVSLSK